MERPTAVALTVVAAVLWGTSFAVNDAGVRELHPVLFTFWRFALAAVASVALARVLGGFSLGVFRQPLVWVLGVLTAGAFLLQYTGQTLTTPARTALFVNSNAIVVALLSWLIFRQPPRARTLAAMALALAGVVLLQSRGDVGVYLGGTPLGDLLTFLSGTCAAGLFVLVPRALRATNAWNVVAGMFVVTTLVTLPLALVAGAAAPPATAAGWGAVAYTALATSTVAYTIWAFTLHRISPTTSAVLLLLEVLVAALVSLALGREVFTPVAVAGAGLLLAGVAWLATEPAPQQD